MDHVEFSDKPHTFVQSHAQTIDKTLEQPGFDTQIIDSPDTEIQGELVFL